MMIDYDDDIVSTVRLMFDTTSNPDVNGVDVCKDKTCQLLQEERNKWKEKVYNFLQEIDKKHRTILATRSTLQELVNSVYPQTKRPCSSEKRQLSEIDLITKLRFYIKETKASKERISKENILLKEVAILRDDAAKLHEENSNHLETISSLTKEITWLQRELISVKHKLERVRGIVKNYNEARSSSFHLDDVVPQEGKASDTDRSNIIRERTYHEGEQTLADTTPREAFSIMKLREKQMNNRGRNDGNVLKPYKHGINKCLRCQNLFRSNENNNMACRFHRKGREITECYSSQGKLLRVVYKWSCCKKPLDVAGCIHGYHI